MLFSNSLIIQKPKTKEIMHRDMLSSISPSKSVCLRSYNKHESQCFITMSKTSCLSKILSYALYFQLSSRYLISYVMKHCVSSLIIITFNIPLTYPLARGSSSFFLVLSPGSAFFFMYLRNLDNSCSKATNTGLICLCSK